MYNPLVLAGFAWDLGGGWGFSSFNGAYGPVDNELRGTSDIWVYNNRSWLGWSGKLGGGGFKDGGGIPFTFSAESVLGLTGNNLQTGAAAAARLLEHQPDRVCDFGQVGSRRCFLRFL